MAKKFITIEGSSQAEVNMIIPLFVTPINTFPLVTSNGAKGAKDVSSRTNGDVGRIAYDVILNIFKVSHGFLH